VVLPSALAAAVGVSAAAGLAAHGAPPQPVAPEPAADPDLFFNSLLAALDSADLRLRDQASQHLATHDSISLEQIESALCGPRAERLSPEQRQRLFEAGRARFSRAPRAAMGVQFDQTGPLRDRIIVERTYDKFPSSRLLEEGDIIDSADGVRLLGPGSRTILRSMIFSREPGESIGVVVRRGAQRLDLAIPLGRYQDLDSSVPLDPDSLMRAWRERLRRAAASPDSRGAAATAVRPPMSADQWRESNQRWDQRRAMTGAGRAGGGPAVRTEPVAGGAPRPRVLDDAALMRLYPYRNLNDWDTPAWRLWPPGEDPDTLARRTASPEEELRAMQMYVENLRLKLGRADQEPANAIDRARRAGLGEGPADRQLRLLEKQLEALKAEADGN
jgi:hypothetical protein